MFIEILTYAAGALTVAFGGAVLVQRIRIITLRQLVRDTYEKNVLLSQEAQKAIARCKEIEDREASLTKRPLVVNMKPEAIQEFAAFIAPAVVEAVTKMLADDQALAKRKPN